MSVTTTTEQAELPIQEPEPMYHIEETADSFHVIICPCATDSIEPFRSGVSFGKCDGYVGRIIYPKSKYTRERVMEIVQQDLPECTKCEDTNIACQSILGQQKKEEVLTLVGGNLVGLMMPAVVERYVDPQLGLPVKLADVLAYVGGLSLGIMSFFGNKLRLSDKQQRAMATVGVVMITSRGIRQIVG